MEGFSGNEKPSFFKILLEPTAKFLPLPPEFIRCHRLLPRDIVLRTTSQESYNLKIKKIEDGRLALCDGWHKVVEDKGLVFGDFIVFWLVNPSTIDVLFYGHSACQKSNSSSTLTNAPRNIAKDVIDILDTEEMNDDVSDDDRYNKTHEEEDDLEHDDEMFNSTKKSVAYHPKFRRELTPTHKFARRLRKEFVKETGMQAGEDDGDNENQPDDALSEPYVPCFQKILCKSHRIQMPFPAKFVKEIGIMRGKAPKMIVIEDPRGKKWRVGLLTVKDGRVILSSGWKALMEKNDLVIGDLCLFEPKSKNHLVLKVFKRRSLNKVKVGDDGIVSNPRKKARKSIQSSSSEARRVEGGDIVKRKRGRPPLKSKRV